MDASKAWWTAAVSLALLAALVEKSAAAAGRQLAQQPAAPKAAPFTTLQASPTSQAPLVPPAPAAPAEAPPAPATEQLQPVPLQYIITNGTLGSFLQRLASPRENAIIFTTTRLPEKNPEAEIAMMSNFCRWLDHVGVLGFTMLLTTDNTTWHTLNARGFPVVLDRVLPERQEYRDGHGIAADTPNRVFDVQKHYWGSTIIRHGFRALYMDSDAIVLRNPLDYFNADYDVQGLSDWHDAELPTVGETLHHACHGGLYFQVPEARVGTGSMLREYWRFGPGDRERALNVANPCQSTGLWYLEPTPMAIRFMAAMRDRLLAPGTLYQWDQTAWNEVIVPFLWGMGDEPPLRYRVLPLDLFAGAIRTYELRLQAGLPANPVVLHCGNLHGMQKHATYERLGLFHGSFSLPARPPPGVAGTNAQRNISRARAAEEARWLAATSSKQQATAVGRNTTGLATAGPGGVRAVLTGSAALLGVICMVGCMAGVLLWRRGHQLGLTIPARLLLLKSPPRSPTTV